MSHSEMTQKNSRGYGWFSFTPYFHSVRRVSLLLALVVIGVQEHLKLIEETIQLLPHKIYGV